MDNFEKNRYILKSKCEKKTSLPKKLKKLNFCQNSLGVMDDFEKHRRKTFDIIV